MEQVDAAEVVQGRGDLDRQREVLLLLESAVAPDQRGQPGALDVLEHDVGPLVLEVVAQSAGHHRVVDQGERLDLPAQAPEGVLVGHLVGPDHLDHDGRRR